MKKMSLFEKPIEDKQNWRHAASLNTPNHIKEAILKMNEDSECGKTIKCLVNSSNE